MAVETPTTIARYQVLKRLDEGGMGTVYLARDPAIDRLVAVKLLREGFDDPELRERFMREARSAGRLKQANIVTIFDVGDHDGQPFITMEYLQGETLHDLIQRRAELPLVRKLQLMDELCAGLHYAHRNGIIHRDIKPKNLITDDEGVLKILDFGIARIGGSGMTQLGAMMGTVNYMAPEQMAGRPIDARADQFSAGAVFYEMLSYRRAFPGDFKTVVQTILGEVKFEPLDAIDSSIDPKLVAIVNRCLARLPDDRYPDMAAVRQAMGSIRMRLSEQEDTGATVRTPRVRNPAFERAMERARTALDGGALDTALARVEEALGIEPADREAIALKQRVATAIAAQRRAEEEVAQARAAIARAQDRFAGGDHTGAIALLEAFQPAQLVANALTGLRRELEEVERRRAEAAERRRQEQTRIDSSERERTVVQSYDSDATVAFQPIPKQMAGVAVNTRRPAPSGESDATSDVTVETESRSLPVPVIAAGGVVVLALLVWILLRFL